MKPSHIRGLETGAETDAEQTVVSHEDWVEPENTKRDNHMQFHDTFQVQVKKVHVDDANYCNDDNY